MDFRQTTQPNNGRPAVVSPAAAAPEQKAKEIKETNPSSHRPGKWSRLFNVIVLVGIAVLLVGIALLFMRGNDDNEMKYVNSKQYQAVFLNNGQVYFGNIDNLNGNYVHMTNIYYLTQSTSTTSTASSSYSLVKLGCQQIHDPTDQMLINRDQVTFWENLQDGGKVVTSINQFQKQNPNGPDCSQVSNQTQASSSDAQGSATTGTGTSSTGTSSTGTSSTGTGSSTTK